MPNTLEQSNRLYIEHIKPHERDFLSQIISIRKRIDAIYYVRQREAWFNDPSIRGNGYHMSIDRYPNGYCLEIRNEVLRILQSEPQYYLSEYLERGGTMRGEWLGFYKNDIGVCFSNVITFGEVIIDPAYEEFSCTSIPIGISIFGRKYKKLNLLAFKDISERYHKRKIYKTTKLLGDLSVFLPFLGVDEMGYIDLIPNGKGLQSNIESIGQEAYTMLKSHNELEGIPSIISEAIIDILSLYRKKEVLKRIIHDTEFEKLNIESLILLMRKMYHSLHNKESVIKEYICPKIGIHTIDDFNDFHTYLYVYMDFIIRLYNSSSENIKKAYEIGLLS